MQRKLIKNFNAFTIIEMLIVIAILGILVTVVLMNVSGAKARAVDSKAKDLMSGVQQSINNCILDGGTPKLTGSPVVGTGICAGSTEVSANWPNIVSLGVGIKKTSWSYSNKITPFDPLTGKYEFVIKSGTSDQDGAVFECNRSGCQYYECPNEEGACSLAKW